MKNTALATALLVTVAGLTAPATAQEMRGTQLQQTASEAGVNAESLKYYKIHRDDKYCADIEVTPADNQCFHDFATSFQGSEELSGYKKGAICPPEYDTRVVQRHVCNDDNVHYFIKIKSKPTSEILGEWFTSLWRYVSGSKDE
eukprot:GFYU01025332.1.p1 GENE.GFYU01025332.1~~GFYU01025332.1.p1  ORF type:complete len:144 (-),score=30.26 GFYU01025332.1:60-491(-)